MRNLVMICLCCIKLKYVLGLREIVIDFMEIKLMVFRGK